MVRVPQGEYPEREVTGTHWLPSANCAAKLDMFTTVIDDSGQSQCIKHCCREKRMQMLSRKKCRPQYKFGYKSQSLVRGHKNSLSWLPSEGQ